MDVVYEGTFTFSGDSGSNDCDVTYDVKMKTQGEPESAWAALPSWATMSSASRGSYGITV